MANRRFLCQKEEESTDHLIHCEVSRFTAFLILIIQSAVGATFMKGLLLSWHGSFLGKIEKVWRVAPFCLFWTMWR